MRACSRLLAETFSLSDDDCYYTVHGKCCSREKTTGSDQSNNDRRNVLSCHVHPSSSVISLRVDVLVFSFSLCDGERVRTFQLSCPPFGIAHSVDGATRAGCILLSMQRCLSAYRPLKHCSSRQTIAVDICFAEMMCRRRRRRNEENHLYINVLLRVKD